MLESIVVSLVAVIVSLVGIIKFLLPKMVEKRVNGFKTNDLSHLEKRIDEIIGNCSSCGEMIGRMDERLKATERSIETIFKRLNKE